MSFPFTPTEQQELRELLGLPMNFGPTTVPARLAVPIADVRRSLALPEVGYRELLTDERWLVGGAVLRWLGQNRFTLASRGDYDFFLPSVEAVNDTVRELVGAGFRFRCFRSWRPFCPFCGGDAERHGWEPAHDDLLPLPKIHCPRCDDGARRETDLPVELSPEAIAARRVTVVEFLSPGGDPFHLSTLVIRPSPGEVVAGCDYSPGQFALDPVYLHGAPHAWTDLLHGRFRLTPGYVDPSYRRMRKYQALGFRPYTGTVIRVLLWNLVPGILSLFRPRRAPA